MLLDRRRIRKWAKWVALALAVIFGLSFLFLGIGYGGAGFDLSEIFSGGCSETTQPDTTQSRLDEYLAALQADPTDTDAMLGAATIYESLYDAGEGEGQQYLLSAAALLQKAVDTDPSLKDVYLRLADLYMVKVGSSAALQAAVAVLNQAVSVDANNPEIYLKLGTAQRSLGNTQAAVLSWQKYLQLAPNGEFADLIREQLKQLAGQNTTTTQGTGTTIGGGTTTSASPTSTSASAPPTTTTTTSLPATSTTG